VPDTGSGGIVLNDQKAVKAICEEVGYREWMDRSIGVLAKY